jgi:hypothetical protein
VLSVSDLDPNDPVCQAIATAEVSATPLPAAQRVAKEAKGVALAARCSYYERFNKSHPAERLRHIGHKPRKKSLAL